MGLGSLITSTPLILQAATQRALESAEAAVVVSYILVAAFLALDGVMARWIFVDAGCRGASAVGWMVAWLAGPLTGCLLLGLAVALGRTADAAWATIAWIVLYGLGVVMVWFATRADTIIFDEKGTPVHPRALLAAEPRFQPGRPPPSRIPIPVTSVPQAAAVGWQPAGGWSSPTPTFQPRPAARTPPPVAQRQVRCPSCQSQFAYVANPMGPTLVRCPGCGLDGTI